MKEHEYTNSLICYVVLFIVPIYLGAFMYAKYDVLDSRQMRAKYEILYKDVSVRRGDRRTVLYLPYYLLKRWILILIPIIMYDDSAL